MSNVLEITTPPSLPVVAVFDFDGTLTRNDSFLPFLRYAFGNTRFLKGMLLASPVLLGYALNSIPNWRAKEAVMVHFLSGRMLEQVNELARNFALDKLPQLLNPTAVQRLRYHQDRGHYTVLVSASLEAYLLPWAKTMGFDEVVGTKLESRAGVLTGCIQGKNCYGQEKVDRLKQVLGDLSQHCIYAYGDSRGDKELLAAANYAYYRNFQHTTGNSTN